MKEIIIDRLLLKRLLPLHTCRRWQSKKTFFPPHRNDINDHHKHTETTIKTQERNYSVLLSFLFAIAQGNEGGGRSCRPQNSELNRKREEMRTEMYNTITQRNYRCWFLLPIVSRLFFACASIFKCTPIVVHFPWGWLLLSIENRFFMFTFLLDQNKCLDLCMGFDASAERKAVSFIPFWAFFALATARNSRREFISAQAYKLNIPDTSQASIQSRRVSCAVVSVVYFITGY